MSMSHYLMRNINLLQLFPIYRACIIIICIPSPQSFSWKEIIYNKGYQH